ncbi:MAG: ABC transporter ATP-binding protein [Deltaproteobacteria bacterium]|nr:ABC transporter ATP-binding protein [Deltaproteobacteria bacterium]
MLKLHNVRTSYGNIEAIKGVSMEIKHGEITAVIGANGAGKSTLLNTISGVLRPASGKIEFMDERIDHLPCHRIAQMGISQVPEGRRIFPKMTVMENLEMGMYSRKCKMQNVKCKVEAEKIFQYFPILKERLKQIGGTLSGGEQQMLAIARALMSMPKLLLLDEPSLGLAPIMVERIFEIIKKINQEGGTVVLVEQNANAALKLANSGYVIETGRIALHDSAISLLYNPHVRAAYLGG